MAKQRNPNRGEDKSLPPDHLDSVNLLTRREIEARIVAPLLKALGEAFGSPCVLEVARQVIVNLARQQGAQLAENLGGCTLAHFTTAMEAWNTGDALELKMLIQSDEQLHFNVTRCRYAEMYHALGIPEMGTLLSCNRDFALIEGFTPNIHLARSQTIMEGATHCDFRYELIKKE